MKTRTTIQIERTTLIGLKELKQYPRETYNDILIRLINDVINKMEDKQHGNGYD